MTITPEIMAALLATGRPFEITPEGGLIVEGEAPQLTARQLRNRRYYENQKRLKTSDSDGDKTLLDGKTSESDNSDETPSPSPIPPSSPAQTHVREAAGQLDLIPKEPASNKAKGTIDEAKAFAVELGLPATDGEWFHAKCEGNGWKNDGKAIRDWKATMRAWKLAGYMASQKQQISRPPHAPRSSKAPDQRSDSSNRPGRYG